jgi:hypothetical protein
VRLRCPVCRQMHERSESGARLMTDHPTLVPDEEQDWNDGKEWSAADLEDLAHALMDGGTVEGAAYFSCRGGTVEEVRQKAKELRLIGE